MDTHAESIDLSKQMRASFDAYLDKLPSILHQHGVNITKYCYDGERQLKIEFVGAELQPPKFSRGGRHLTQCYPARVPASEPELQSVFVHKRTCFYERQENSAA